MHFKVKIENFEGPIDALLQMIEKRKMTISDVSLAEIAEEYVQFVASLGDSSISDITHFVFVASTLTLIKSKSLLPNLELTEEEEGDIDDLKKRIEIFKIYQSASLEIKSSMKTKPVFYGAKARKREISFTPDSQLNLALLENSLMQVLNEVPEKETKKKEARMHIAVHIEEMMFSLEDRIKKHMNTNFSNFISDSLKGQTEPKAVRVYKVVGFLAMLELVKKGALFALQDQNFDAINIESAELAQGIN